MTKNTPPRAASDYEVGRGKPPRASRFKPGQSGNPGGRKKGSLNLKTILTAVMESEIEVAENGRKRTVTRLEALILGQVQVGLRGNTRASDSLLNRYERLADVGVEQGDELPEDDQALLERALNSRRRVSSERARGPAAADLEEDTDHD